MVLVNSGRVGSCHIYLQRSVFERKWNAFFMVKTELVQHLAVDQDEQLPC